MTLALLTDPGRAGTTRVGELPGVPARQEGKVPVRPLEVGLEEAELAERLAAWRPPPPRYEAGVFARYRALVSSASEGAVLRA